MKSQYNIKPIYNLNGRNFKRPIRFEVENKDGSPVMSNLKKVSMSRKYLSSFLKRHSKVWGSLSK